MSEFPGNGYDGVRTALAEVRAIFPSRPVFASPAAFEGETTNGDWDAFEPLVTDAAANGCYLLVTPTYNGCGSDWASTKGNALGYVQTAASAGATSLVVHTTLPSLPTGTHYYTKDGVSFSVTSATPVSGSLSTLTIGMGGLPADLSMSTYLGIEPTYADALHAPQSATDYTYLHPDPSDRQANADAKFAIYAKARSIYAQAVDPNTGIPLYTDEDIDRLVIFQLDNEPDQRGFGGQSTKPTVTPNYAFGTSKALSCWIQYEFHKIWEIAAAKVKDAFPGARVISPGASIYPLQTGSDFGSYATHFFHPDNLTDPATDTWYTWLSRVDLVDIHLYPHSVQNAAIGANPDGTAILQDLLMQKRSTRTLLSAARLIYEDFVKGIDAIEPLAGKDISVSETGQDLKQYDSGTISAYEISELILELLRFFVRCSRVGLLGHYLYVCEPSSGGTNYFGCIPDGLDDDYKGNDPSNDPYKTPLAKLMREWVRPA